MDEHQNPFASPLAEESAVVASPELAKAESIRRAHLSREASIKSVGILYYLGAVLITIGVIGITFVAVMGQTPPGDDTGILIGLLALYTILAGLSWWIAPGLRRLNPSVRPWVIGLSILGLLNIPIGTLISGYILWIMTGEKAKMVFSPAYKEVIAATPHIKHKTSILVWILLAVVILFLLVGVVAVATS